MVQHSGQRANDVTDPAAYLRGSPGFRGRSVGVQGGGDAREWRIDVLGSVGRGPAIRRADFGRGCGPGLPSLVGGPDRAEHADRASPRRSGGPNPRGQSRSLHCRTHRAVGRLRCPSRSAGAAPRAVDLGRGLLRGYGRRSGRARCPHCLAASTRDKKEPGHLRCEYLCWPGSKCRWRPRLASPLRAACPSFGPACPGTTAPSRT